jgi:GT2 family glycosyltransferase
MTTDPVEPVTLCIINYNGLAYLQEAVANLQALSTRFDEILVVDNGSSDGSLSYLDTIDKITVLALPSNNGPASARNAGFLQARHDVILFQDNDISLTDGVVEALYKTLQMNTKVLLTVPRVVYKSHPDIIQYESADCHLLGMMILRQANTRTDLAPMEITQTSSMVSACFMIDRRRWHNLSLPGRSQHSQSVNSQPLFDEDFIFNLEDHDLGVRANLLGFSILAVPHATVKHGVGTEGLSYRPGRNTSATRMYCLIRNRWWIVCRYYSLRSLIILSPLMLAFELLQLAGVILKGWGKEWWRAFVDTIRHLPALLAERNVYQDLRQRADHEILHIGNLPLTQAMNSGIVARIGIGLFEIFMHGYGYLVKKLL